MRCLAQCLAQNQLFIKVALTLIPKEKRGRTEGLSHSSQGHRCFLNTSWVAKGRVLSAHSHLPQCLSPGLGLGRHRALVPWGILWKVDCTGDDHTEQLLENWAMMQPQQRPHLTPRGAPRLRWPCKVVPGWDKRTEYLYLSFDWPLEGGRPGKQVSPWAR